MATWDAISRAATLAASRLRVKSAFAPLLYFCGIALPSLLWRAAQFIEKSPAVALALIGLVMLIVLFTMCAYAWFAVTNPRLLQSEDYQLRHETLEIFRHKMGKVQMDSASLPTILKIAGHIESPEETK